MSVTEVKETQPRSVIYRERVIVPVWWWLVAASFVLSLVVAVGFYAGMELGWAAGAIGMAVVALVLLPMGKQQIIVSADGLRVGEANIAWDFVSSVRSWDAEQTRERLGPKADARAYLFQRPYLREAVEVTLDDPADPHPYWLINTRHREQLTQAIGRFVSVVDEG